MDQQRERRYERIYAQLCDLIVGKSPSLQAAMATLCALLHAKMPHHSWTGFYVVASEDELHVGPYQGPVACQVLKGAGVCLHAARVKEPVVVPDVEAFSGHIPCDARTKSEIVIPIVHGGAVLAVLDIDSHQPGQFTEEDIVPLQRIVSLLDAYL